ncbi:MAG: hypothetical protein JHC83_00565, partial [Thermoleophilia bacterium]|nr:hypothetical protein [Thermoleophilia bacterium]
MRRLIPVLALMLTLSIFAASAQAAARLSAAQVATAMTARHAFVQPGVSPQPDIAALTAVAAANPSFYLVVLARPLAGAANAKGSARLLAQALQAKDPQATVGLITKGKLGGASLSYPQDRINKAVADTRAVAATDPVGSLTSYAAAVTKPNKTADETGATGSSGRPWWQWAVVVLLLGSIVLVVLRIRARSNEQRRRRRGGSIWTAREFHLDRLESLAARHMALTGETATSDGPNSDDPEAADHLQTAGARLLALRRTLPALTSPRELRTVAGELDAVEWEILWVEYRLADHAPPAAIAPGFPGLCFFSHEHGLGTEAIELRKPDGTINTVYVSPENRLALERGDAPEVSLVHVGSRMIPWPAAPSWYGAYGWSPDDLPGLDYNGEQIWGIDGPERDEEPPADEASSDLTTPPATASGIVPTQDGELALPEEEATRAWDPDSDAAFEDVADVAAPAEATPPIVAPPAQPVVEPEP